MVMLMQCGWTSLMLTATRGDEEIFDFLLVEHNADVHDKED